MEIYMIKIIARSAALAAALAGMAPVAALAQDKPDGQWRGSGGASLAATSGNSSTQALALTVDSVRLTAADKIALGAFINYGKNKVAGVSTTTADKWLGFGQYDFNLSPRMVAFGRLSLEGDGVADLNLRSAVAGGLGYKIIDAKDTKFTVYGGLGYTTDKYDVAKTIAGKTGTNFSRSSLYLAEESSHQLSATTAFKQRLDVFPGLSGDKAVIAKFTAGLSVAMSSTMSLNIGLQDSYNSKPALGQKKNDLALLTGVNVKFGAL
jgi:putative salt-induced outer membrane protein